MKKWGLLLFFFIPLNLIPCGWDWDTIKMEKEKFPSIHELIVGKFLRHSTEFYYWREVSRKNALKKYPDSLALYDDLGVAYDKQNKHQEAIDIMLRKEKKSPGLYETYANLGTFYIHNSQYTEGLAYIKKAIAINPDAHFGREIYQQRVVEYLLEKQVNGKTNLPLVKKNRSNNFYDFLLKTQWKNKSFSKEEKSKALNKAIKGIAGMMKFGNYQSPILLECLGDLLLETEGLGGAGHLASRAFLKASFETKDDAKKEYRNKAQDAIEVSYAMRGGLPNELTGEVPIEYGYRIYNITKLEKILAYELKVANDWFEELKTNELNWIASGINPDSAFAATYYSDPKELGDYEYSKSATAFYDSLNLANPSGITDLIQNSSLSDSMKKIIDSLYAEEIPAVDSTVASTSVKEEKSETKKSYLWYYVAGVIGVGLLIMYYESKKTKDED